MTSIVDLRLHRTTVPLVRPFVTAVRTATEIEALLVEVIDSDGRSGWGEAPTSWRVTGESPASVTAAIEGPLRDAVLGMLADSAAAAADASLALDRAVVRNSAARMAVDCAIYDLAAQAAGLPLHMLLTASASAVPGRTASTAPGPTTSAAPGHTTSTAPGHTASTAPGPTTSAAPGHTTSTAPGHTTSATPGRTVPSAPGPTTPTAPGHTAPSAPGRAASSVRTDMTLSAASNADGIRSMAETALRHRDAGFGTLKLKVGAGADDVAAMRAVRDAVGPDVTLRADANQGWSPERAVSVIQAWEDAGLAVELVEQPVHRDDLEGLAFVTAHVDTPVLADESVWTTRDAREVIARRAADMVNIKLAKTGGIREALAVLDLAERAGMSAIVGCMMESHVGIAAASAVAATIDARSGSATAHDLDAGLWLSEAPVLGGIEYDGEIVMMSLRAGLGIRGLRD
ncbi:hypothetical protein GCM10028798_34740 [Humibacter antri]